jgi:MFS family permease
VSLLSLVGEVAPGFQPLIAPEWTTGWVELLFGVVSLCILMGILLWVYHSMQEPRLYLGRKQADQPGSSSETATGEPTITWEAILRYLVTTAIALTIWYVALLVFLTVATKDRSAEDIALAAAVVVGTARLLAHINPEASHEIGKSVPLVIVSIILIGGASGEENFINVLTDIAANTDAIDNFYWMLLIADILITTVWALLVRSRWRAKQPGSRRLEIRKSLAPLRESIRSIRTFGRPVSSYDWRTVSNESDAVAREVLPSALEGTVPSDVEGTRKPPKPTNGPASGPLDSARVADYAPESWDERPEYDDGADRYAAERPPHHGD